MSARRLWVVALAAGLALTAPVPAHAGDLSVEVWTDRGNDAVYQPGDAMQIKARASHDAYLLVYEIDAEGAVHVLFPYESRPALVEGRHTYRIPSDDAGVDLVVQGPVGEGYIVAIASAEPFRSLPWYLRPYDPKGEALGYVGQPEEEDGITAEGRIVGDPFVAMERIRRRAVERSDDTEAFATAYTSYYVHHEVRYPRYVCYDCHRPSHWAWWDGFDPYYATCSVVDLRVNWAWSWGRPYWVGFVPYYCYSPRAGLGPRYRHWAWNRGWYSSWDGWGRWNKLWGGPLVRYKSPPPPGYRPPADRGPGGKVREGGGRPPGFLDRTVTRTRYGMQTSVPIGANRRVRDEGSDPPRRERASPVLRRDAPERMPVREVRRDDGAGHRVGDAGRQRDEVRRQPASPAPRVERAPPPRVQRAPEGRPAPRQESPRVERSPEHRAPDPQPAREQIDRAPRERPQREPAREKRGKNR